jgi:CubicO group peptidase (beta-lactamase class C family)
VGQWLDFSEAAMSLSSGVRSMLVVLCLISSQLANPQPPQPIGTSSKPAAKKTANPASNLQDFDAFVQRTMSDWKVPGAAIAIVKDGKVVSSKCYGLRDVKNNLPVTDQTLFPIASITKSFTVATLGTLSSEGKLDWDKPVREYLPDFRLSDDVLTARVTPRDLVTHRTGLPRHDATWYRSGLTREEMYARLRYLEPNRDLRREFQYNNLMFMTAGYLAGKLSGSTWEEAVTARIFQPLGMRSSGFDFGASFKSASDVAHPYRKDDKEVIHEAPIYPGDPALGPAGAIVSNLSDMTQYLLMYLNHGQHDGRQIIAQSDIRQMISPQMVMRSSDLDPEIGYPHYGMGLFVTTYRGHKFVQHGGNLDGFSLLISFLPDDNVGSVILLNMDGSSLREVLADNINDRLLGLDLVDWNKRELDRYFAFKKSDEEAREKNYVPRRENTKFSHPIDEYVGEYSNPAYGTVVIARAANDRDLKISYHTMESTAEHWHYDVWRVPHDPLDLLQETEIMFHTDWEGNIASLSSSMEPSVKDIIFTRMPDRRMRERGFLEPLAGVYQVADFKFVVALRADNVLTVTTPNQRVWELEPVRGNTFAVKGENGLTLDFKRDQAGKVTEFSLNQAGSSSVYKKTQ